MVALGYDLVTCVTIELKHANEAGEMADGTLGPSIGHIAIGDAEQVDPAPWTIVVGVGEEPAGIGLAAGGIEHECRDFVSKEQSEAFKRSNKRSARA